MSAQPSTPTLSDDPARTADTALCRGVLYTALALGFRPPNEETELRLMDPRAAAALADAAALIDADAARPITQAAAALADPAADLAQLAAAYRSLFGHTARGEVPPYETEYGDEALFQQPQELSDLAGFVHAFGLTLRPASHERIDHISCECELAAFLAYKEAYARTEGDSSMLAVTLRATALFLRDHLGRFTPSFARQLRRANRSGFYGRLGHLLDVLVASDCRRFEIARGSELLHVRPDPVCNAPMGCESDGQGCGAGPCPT